MCRRGINQRSVRLCALELQPKYVQRYYALCDYESNQVVGRRVVTIDSRISLAGRDKKYASPLPHGRFSPTSRDTVFAVCD